MLDTYGRLAMESLHGVCKRGHLYFTNNYHHNLLRDYRVYDLVEKAIEIVQRQSPNFGDR